MARPIMLGIVGDSASGKTTLSKGLVRLLGEDAVTHICTDDYHKYDRRQRAERGITPLNPECNYLDIMAQHLQCLRLGEPILKPVYQHHDGTFGPLVYLAPETLHRRRGAARLPHRGDAHGLRRARLPRPAGVAAAPVEGRPRLLQARLHDRRGARRPRPPRARLGGVHPPAARATPTWSSAAGERRGPVRPRRRARRCATRLPHPDLSPVRRGERRRDHDDGARRRVPAVHPRRRCRASARRRSRRRSGTACTSPATCAPRRSASSRSATTCTARSRWRSSSC